MTIQTLPDNLDYCFCPSYDVEDDIQQICIVVEGMAGYIPTAIAVPDIENARNLCDRLNARLGHTREDWTRMVAQSMDEDSPEPTH